jgi:HK97 gp10 family phage protein
MYIKMFDTSKLVKELAGFADPTSVSSIVEKALEEGASIVVNEMKSQAPKDTGKMADSITQRRITDVPEGKIVVGIRPRVRYYRFVEFGTIHQPPQPFMNRTWSMSKESTYNTIINRLDSEFRKRGAKK